MGQNLISNDDVVIAANEPIAAGGTVDDSSGDIVLRTGGVERARITKDGTGAGLLGVSVPLTAIRLNALRMERVTPLADRTVNPSPVPSDVTVTSTSGASSNIVGTAQTFAANVVSKFRWSRCRKADQTSPFNPLSPGGTCDGTNGSTTVVNVSNLSLANGNTVLVYDSTGSTVISQASTTISSGGGTSTLVLSKSLNAGGTGLLIGVPVGTYRANAPQPNVSAGGPDSAIASSFDYMAYSALTEITIFTRKGPAAGAWYEIFVDGALVSAITNSPSTIGNRSVVHIALTAARAHHVQMISRGVDILQVQAGPVDAVWLPSFPLCRARCLIIGDSWTASANDSRGRGYLTDLCETLGWDPVPCGQSGSGYTLTGSAGTGVTNYTDRVALIANEAPDVIIFAGGLNDLGASPTAIQAAASAAYAAALAVFPTVPVIVIGVQDTPGGAGYNSATTAAADAAIQAAAAAAPNVIGFVSVLGSITGTGNSATNRTVTDGVLNSTTTVTSATAAFVAGDVGKVITGTGIPAYTTIASRTNGTTVVLSQAATATASGVTLAITNANMSGNADVFMSVDPFHLIDGGHRYFGMYVAQKVAALVAATAVKASDRHVL